MSPGFTLTQRLAAGKRYQSSSLLSTVCRRCQYRNFSATARRALGVETITVPCRSNGSITLEVFHPLHPPSPDTHIPTVPIYLSRGPLFADPAHDASNTAILRAAFRDPVVRIHYRCSTSDLQPYPVPLHDVLAGYDWVVANLLPRRAFARQGRAERVGRVVVCGELLGAQLAAALALSECRVGEPGIIAAAVNNAVTDWTSLEEDGSDEQSWAEGLGSGLRVSDLLRHRSRLFRRPEHYFDPFASPALFFRSPGRIVPSAAEVAPQPVSEMDELALLDRQDFFQEQLALSAISSTPSPSDRDVESDTYESPEHTNHDPTLPSDLAAYSNPSTTPDPQSPPLTTLKSPRKASRRFPSKALDLHLPRFAISHGSPPLIPSQLVAQSSELAHLLRQSYIRQLRDASSSTSRGRRGRLSEDTGTPKKLDAETEAYHLAAAEERLVTGSCEGLGLWDDSPAGRERMRGVAEWLRDAAARG